jgi:Sulfotransferase domain
MIVWLASYPRSGNTFFRALLKQVYDLPTYDLHEPDPGPKLAYEHIFGSARLEVPISELHHDDRHHIVKTHDMAQEDHPAIYIVRDGRDVLVSYARLLLDPRDSENRDAYLSLLRHLIESSGSFGGWSGNVRAWMARRTPTVVVRFDDLITRPMDELRRAMTAVGFTPPETGASTPPAFDDLQKLSPHFFRKGRTGAWREDMPRELHLLFWRRHGETMRALGYRDDEPTPQEFADMPSGVHETLTFAVGGTGCAALGDGWGEPEGWGTWSVDRRASMLIAVGPKPLFPLEVDLSYRSFVDKGRTLEITCRAVGKQISSWICSPVEWRGVRRIGIPPEAVTTEGIVELDFEISAPKSPAELGLGPDTRRLGIGIESMRLRTV